MVNTKHQTKLYCRDIISDACIVHIMYCASFPSRIACYYNRALYIVKGSVVRFGSVISEKIRFGLVRLD